MSYEKTLKSNQVKPSVAISVIAKGSKGGYFKSQKSKGFQELGKRGGLGAEPGKIGFAENLYFAA